MHVIDNINALGAPLDEDAQRQIKTCYYYSIFGSVGNDGRSLQRLRRPDRRRGGAKLGQSIRRSGVTSV